MNKEFAWESQDSNAAFFTGLLAGALIGAGVGVLFAPRRGSELRGQVAESAANVGQVISKTVDTWTERGREAYDRARDVAVRAGEEVDRAVSDASQTVESGVNRAGDQAASAVRRVEHAASRG
jgi:gas vesicle protein